VTIDLLIINDEVTYSTEVP